MEIIYAPQALNDLEFWKKSGNKPLQRKISELIGAISKDPFQGIRRPEQLKHQLSGRWSRRINSEHRIVYLLKEDTILILSLKGHYQ